MQSDDEKRSLFAEVAARRSRSADLARRAVEQGVAVVEIPADPPAADELANEPTDTVTEIPNVAANDASVFCDEIQAISDEDAPDYPETLKEAEDDAAVEATSIEDAVEDSEAAEAASEVSDDVGLEPHGLDKAETEIAPGAADAPTESQEVAGQETPNDDGEKSDPFPGADLDLPEDLEESLEAEKLADQIGQVVDIQRLPKTKPMRVLSKAARGETGAAGSPKKPDRPEESGVPLEAPDLAAESNSPAKKKKRATLLDSYFKGL